MADSRVAARYALALFRTALSMDVVASVEDDFNGIAGLVENDPDFKEFVLSPYVSREEKVAIAEKLFSDRVTALSMSAIRLILTKRREAEIVGIRDAYLALRREHGGILFVEVVTAEAMDNDQKQQLEMKLAKKTARTVEAHYSIDPHIVGGIRVTYDSFVFDGSVRGRFRRLNDLLLHDVLKQA